MNTDDALTCVAQGYCVPREVLLALIVKARGEEGSPVTNFALVNWLREEAQKYERGLGHYGHPIHQSTLNQIALLRLCADRLETATNQLNPPGEPVACA
jgi:hypothetical protein